MRFYCEFSLGCELASLPENNTDSSQLFNVNLERFRIHRDRMIRSVASGFDHEMPLDNLGAQGRRNDGSQ